MVMITGRFDILAEKREEFLVFARELVPHERGVRGCRSFEIFEDVTIFNRFLMFETWDNETVLDRHTESEAYAQNNALLDTFISGEPSWDEFVF
jgi:quinol monooxygenase YgiN